MSVYNIRENTFRYFPNEWKGVIHAAENTIRDIAIASGYRAELSFENGNIVFGTLHIDPEFDRFLSESHIDTTRLEHKAESYLITVVGKKLITVGSDKRGTIYGLYTLLDNLDISPWMYWADAADHSPFLNEINVDLGDHNEIFHGEPSVCYRGLFLNDENPALTTFVKQFGENPGRIDDPANTIGQISQPIHESTTHTSPGFNHHFYTKLFDLILRLKGNYLWPAMWNSSFWIDDPENGRLADEYGIVMGTSHQEFLATPDKEWGQFSSQFTSDGSPEPWDYLHNSARINEMWHKNVQQRSTYENVYTVGMRGLNDTEILPEGTTQENVAYLNKVLLAQREILQSSGLGPATTPQMIVLYKEVEHFYYAGWNKSIANDVILTLCDDNHGNLRSLPTEEMRAHPGGFGMYYHFDYYGGPRSYRWQDSISLERTREQMTMAFHYGVRKLWVVNVGDLKPLETPIEYWFRLAYDIDEWGNCGDEQRFREFLAKREFGQVVSSNDVQTIADIIREYQSVANARRPEWVSPATFNYASGEWDDIIHRLSLLLERALSVADRIPDDYASSYYEFVLYKVRSIFNVYQVMYHLGRNQYGIGDSSEEARLAQYYVDCDSRENERYNTFHDGKWNGYGLEYHIGQFCWDTMKEQLQFRIYSNEAAYQSPDYRTVDYRFGPHPAISATHTPVPLNGISAKLATSFSRNISISKFAWTVLPYFGRLESGIKVQPDVLHSLTPGVDSPYVEYTFKAQTGGRIAVATQWAPSNGTDHRHLTTMRYGIEIVEEPQAGMQTIDTLPPHFTVVNALGNSWASGVETQVRTVNLRDPRQNISYHTLSHPGPFTVRIYMVDDGLTLEKIITAELETPDMPMIASWPSLDDPAVFGVNETIESESEKGAAGTDDASGTSDTSDASDAVSITDKAIKSGASGIRQQVELLPLALVGPTDGSDNTPYSYFGPEPQE